jgi:hypothetical protein
MITNAGRCIREIKYRFVMAKAAFNKNKTLFTNKWDFSLRKKLVKCYNLSKALYDAETWTLRKVDQKFQNTFLNVMLEKDGEDKLDRSCEK